ncbi:hypothetical protein Nepgr_019926 [Nepenthes gracilis]|uniref:Uncharacterized protein n=1 Tax=Nepenthes gracilis TaxID=150966 RepID=A0AAD3SVW1_NEPGR|nr:hypothetical protein Nepgr_019926 [Nepenthes gracilis]
MSKWIETPTIGSYFFFSSQRPVSELDAAAVKLPKVYKSYRTRRNLADCAVVIEELWLVSASIFKCAEVGYPSRKRSKHEVSEDQTAAPMHQVSQAVVVENGKLTNRKSGKLVETVEDSKWIFVLSTSRALFVGQKKKGFSRCIHMMISLLPKLLVMKQIQWWILLLLSIKWIRCRLTETTRLPIIKNRMLRHQFLRWPSVCLASGPQELELGLAVSGTTWWVCNLGCSNKSTYRPWSHLGIPQAQPHPIFLAQSENQTLSQAGVHGPSQAGMPDFCG